MNEIASLIVPANCKVKGNLITNKLYSKNIQCKTVMKSASIMSDIVNSKNCTVKENTSTSSIEANSISYENITINGNKSPFASRLMIIMWYGKISDIPSGWVICNGTNGTPDLREKFVIGAGKSYKVGKIGGRRFISLQTSNIPRHRHFGKTTKGGAHNHLQWVGGLDDRNFSGVPGQTPAADAPAQHRRYWTNSNNSAHSHNLKTNITGGKELLDMLPPYRSILYIMKK